ncbi:VanW family protein [Shouchella shacheensis]|uniref:VanW family protein n=1 Tax=Shouchella shacheensis TaxID=1649580 RepID=UPI000740086E|nr:VanW family protein [Shouchella shacheensis]
MKKLTGLSFALLLVVLSGCGEKEEKTTAQLGSKAVGAEERTVPDYRVAVSEEGNEDFYEEIPLEQINEDYLQEWAKELARGENGYDQEMKAPKYVNGSLEGGSKQVILNEEELVDNVLNTTYWNRHVPLPLDTTEPNVSVESLEGVENETIGAFQTAFNTGIKGRAENIQLSTDSIHQTVLGPGDTFSFHQTVGQATAERGYKEASVIIDGEFTDGLGGGICQTSTTLYNAVMEAGLEVVERHPHSLPVGYVPEGSDAMVSWGWADFRFKNTLDVPVLIQGSVDKNNGTVAFEVRAREGEV